MNTSFLKGELANYRGQQQDFNTSYRLAIKIY